MVRTLRFRVMAASLVVCLGSIISCGSAKPDPRKNDPGVVSINADAPWQIEFAGAKKEACPSKDGWLTPKVLLNAAHPKVLLRLDLADVPGLDGCAPVKVEEFTITLNCPSGLAGSSHSRSGWAMFVVDGKDWKYREPGKHGEDWENISRRTSNKVLPKDFSKDASAVGVYVSLNDLAPQSYKFDGTFRMKIDLSVRPSKPAKPNLPEKGQVMESLAAKSGWSANLTYKGGTSAAVTKACTQLLCDLDATDPARLSAVAKLSIPPRDMRKEGLFLTVDIPEGLTGTDKFKSGIHAGLTSHDGKEVFWGPWRTLARPGPITVALYPETRFPLPMSFHSAGFDPAKVTGVCVRLTVDQATKMKYKGPVTIQTAEIVSAPKNLIDKRDRIARNVNRNLIPPRKKDAIIGKVNIRDFIKNIGVNYPWPPDCRGEGIYPVIPGQCWDANGKQGGLELVREQIEKDFAMYARNKIALVRVWLMCDLRRGLIKDAQGNSILDKNCWKKDLGILLSAAEKAGIEIIPVLLDFTLADGSVRERLGVVGEELRILTDPAARKAFLKSVAPLIDELCKSKAVRYIDLWNEPGQMLVPMDAVRDTLCGLAALIDKRKPITVGVRNSVELSWWTARVPIDVPTFHWFAKMEGNCYPKAWAPKDVDRSRTIATEVEATRGVAATLTELYKAGFKGCLFWSAYANDGISPFRDDQTAEFHQWIRKRTTGTLMGR